MQKIITVKRPIANILSTASRGLAVTAISGYQKFISPHKGFACAHRVLYGCESCSQYFKQVIAEEGIFIAIANAKGRFQECHEANEIIKKRRAKCKSRREYYASRLRSNTLAIESGEPENPDIPEDAEPPNNKKLGGSQWQRKQRSQVNNSGTNDNCNNCADCSNCNINPSDCLIWRNSDNSSDASECPDLSFPDLSCPDLNCGNADCLSGMDCSGLDCSGVGDCGSCS